MITQKRLDKFLETGKDQCLSIERSKKHCSLIIYKNQIVSVGINGIGKTHPEAKRIGYRYDEVHSELDAVLKCKYKKNLTLLNLRFNRFGEMRIARPCQLCMPWCKMYFDSIYYTMPEGVVKLEY
jgi:hypothetical protein|tara:strand:+ start:58 stop:432 length:375 start_codon:yes stop_codon:yes gene_type:complete